MFAYLLSSMVPSISYKNYITFNVSKELTFAPYKDKNQLGLHLTLRQMMYPILSYAPVVVLFLAIVIMIKLLQEFRTEIVFLCEVMLFFRINKNARKRKNKFFLSHYIVSFYLLLAWQIGFSSWRTNILSLLGCLSSSDRDIWFAVLFCSSVCFWWMWREREELSLYFFKQNGQGCLLSELIRVLPYSTSGAWILRRCAWSLFC